MELEDWPFGDAWSLRGNKEVASRYEILERIGEGTFGEVFRARRRADGLIVALKEIHNADSSSREMKALLLLDHPNVVRLHEYFALGDSVVLVLEYLPFDLFRVLRAGKGRLPEAEVKGWMIQILRGLAACHSASIVHRDIKPSNLLISEGGALKIADFGQARILQPRSAVDNSTNGIDVRDSHCAPHHEGNEDQNPKIAPASRPEVVTDTHGEQLESQTYDSTCRSHSGNRNVGAGEQEDSLTLSRDLLDEEKITADSAVRSKCDLGESDVDEMAGTINVGHSVLADAVKDAKNYFTVEEIYQSGAEADCLDMLPLQRKEILRSEGTQISNGRNSSSSQALALHRGQISSHLQPPESEGRETNGHDPGFPSEASSNGQHFRTREDSTKALDGLDAPSKIGVSVVPDKREDAFMHKLRRFIGKRTRGHYTEVNGIVSGEQKAVRGSGHKVGKDRTDRQHKASPTIRHSRLPDKHYATLNGASDQEDLPQRSDQLVNGSITRRQHNGVNDCRENENDCGSHETAWKESANGMKEARVERTPVYRSSLNGPLRDLACIDAEKNLITATSTTRGQQRDDDYRRRERASCELDVVEDRISPRFDKSENFPMDSALESRNRGAENIARSPDVLPTKLGNSTRVWTLEGSNEEIWEASRSEEGPFEVWAEGSEENFKEGRSWDKMDRCDSALSEAEGTRWYGAPDFQFSYIDSKAAERESMVENFEASRSDEWEDSSGLHADYESRFLQENNEKDYDRSEDESSDFTTMVGTRWYKAPELLYGATKYGLEVDIWAVGCVFGELLGGKALFPGTSDLDQLSRVVRVFGSPNEATWPGVSLLPDFDKISFDEDRPPLSVKAQLPNVPDLALQFLEKLLRYDPKSRLCSEEAVENSFFHTDPLPRASHELQLPTMDERVSSEEEWDNWREPDSPLSDYEILSKSIVS